MEIVIAILVILFLVGFLCLWVKCLVQWRDSAKANLKQLATDLAALQVAFSNCAPTEMVQKQFDSALECYEEALQLFSQNECGKADTKAEEGLLLLELTKIWMGSKTAVQDSAS